MGRLFLSPFTGFGKRPSILVPGQDLTPSSEDDITEAQDAGIFSDSFLHPPFAQLGLIPEREFGQFLVIHASPTTDLLKFEIPDFNRDPAKFKDAIGTGTVLNPQVPLSAPLLDPELSSDGGVVVTLLLFRRQLEGVFFQCVDHVCIRIGGRVAADVLPRLARQVGRMAPYESLQLIVLDEVTAIV